MMRFRYNIATAVLPFLAIIFSRCTEAPDPAAEQKQFTRIYDNNRFDASYEPLDIIQTQDGGYLVLATQRLDDSNFRGIYLLKTDARGAFVSETEGDADLVSPVAPLLTVQGRHYFFAMSSVGLQSQLVEVDENGGLIAVVEAGGSYPSAAAVDGDNLLLLNYDIDNRQSVISLINPAGSTILTKSFPIGTGDAVEEPIIKHFLRTGRKLPFRVGKASSGLYYFNGFYNYTISLVFTDFNADDPVGVVQGQQDDEGLSGLNETSPGQFAVSRFDFGDHYFLPSTTLESSQPSKTVNLGGHALPELESESPVVIHNASNAERDLVIFGANTKGKQIALYGYDPTDGTFRGTRYIGFSNTFEIAAMASTTDNGLVVCGITYLAGRFPRICIFKLSSESIGESFK
jgi:hypothetical protein